jgi:TRAP-type C4-dicarboxylate transport system permease large subunit
VAPSYQIVPRFGVAIPNAITAAILPVNCSIRTGGPVTLTPNAPLVSSRGPVCPMFALIVAVLGGVYGGIATPTEIGAFGALAVSFLRRRLNWQNFTHTIDATLRLTTMIIFITIAAHVFGYFISFTKITDALPPWISESGKTPFQAVVFVTLGLLVSFPALTLCRT